MWLSMGARGGVGEGGGRRKTPQNQGTRQKMWAAPGQEECGQLVDHEAAGAAKTYPCEISCLVNK